MPQTREGAIAPALEDLAIVFGFLERRLNTRPERSEIVFDYRDVAITLGYASWQQKAHPRCRGRICEAMRAVARAPDCLPGWYVEVDPDGRLFTLRARRTPTPLGPLASAAQ